MSRLSHLARVTAQLSMSAAFLCALSAAGPAWAADDVTPPADPVAKAAFDVLDKHCARCHQEGPRLTERERPAKNFGNVLNLEELAETPSLILPGNPHGSKLFKQIVDQEMPYDVMYEAADKPGVSEAELKALETWIASLGSGGARKIAVEAAPAAPPASAPSAPARPADIAVVPPPTTAPDPAPVPAEAEPKAPVAVAGGCDAHQFVSHKDMIGLMASDLDNLPKARQKGTRYLTLTHLTNACAKEKALEVYRQGAVKLANSLSRSSDVVRLETIDPDQSILRINIDDLGWEAADWDGLIAAYPYATQPETQLTAVLQGATGTKLPYARADWFAFTASRPPVYEKLLKLPKTFQALAKEQGVDVDGNIKKFLAQRAGFQKSGVSQNNRLIERHASRSGYFWTSYDFAGNRRKQSLFEHPTGPGGANGFDHDGGETIFSLPNGFQGYYLNTAKGDALDKGPTSIVRDLSRKDLTVTNGISCMGCHDQGMRKAKDDVRAIVVQGRSFPRPIREAVEALYVPHQKMDQIIADDGKRFTDAMARAGLNPTLKLNGVEMINALSDRYEADVDQNLAAAEFGMTREAFVQAAADADKKYRQLIRRLDQGTVPRDQFEALYAELAPEITDEQAVQVAATAPAAPGAAAPAKPAVAKAKGSEAEQLALTSDKDAYKVGDTPTFTVVAAKDCFLTLINVDDKGHADVIFPNKFQQDNRVKAKAEVQLPGPKAPFQFRFADKGSESVIAVCADKSAPVDGLKHNFTRSAFTSTPDYTRSVAGSLKRRIDVVPTAAPAPAKPGAPAAAPKPAPEIARESVRAAIKIEVE